MKDKTAHALIETFFTCIAILVVLVTVIAAFSAAALLEAICQ